MNVSDLQTFLLANGAVGLGAAIQATVGFGMNLIALPLLMTLGDDYVPAPLLVAHFVLVACLSSLEWRRVERPALAAALAGALPGTLLGMITIVHLSRAGFVLFTAAVLILGIIAVALQIRVPRTPVAVGLAGALSGLCGTTTSINGPPVGMLMVGASGLAAIRATLAVFLLCSTVLSLLALYFAGRLDGPGMVLAAGLVPGVLGGLAVSKLFLHRIADALSPRAVLLTTSAIATAIFLGKEYLS